MEKGNNFKEIWNRNGFIGVKVNTMADIGLDSYDATAFVRACSETLENNGMNKPLFVNVFLLMQMDSKGNLREMFLYMPYLTEEESGEAMDILENDPVIKAQREKHGISIEDLGPGFYDEGTRFIVLSRKGEVVKKKEPLNDATKGTKKTPRMVRGIAMYHEMTGAPYMAKHR